MLNSRALVTAAVAGLFMITNAVAQPAASQAPKTPPVGAVLGTGAVTSFVEDMDESLAFYHDAFGMEVPELPASGGRPYNPSNVQLFAMFDIAGAKERHQSARLGDARIEVMEIQQVDHRTIPLRLQDPDTVTLVFLAEDVDAT